MNSLNALMGLNAQGIPADYPMQGMDPMQELALQGDNQALMEQMGMPYEDPYAQLGGEDPMGMSTPALTEQALGYPLPQNNPADYEGLAQMLGLANNNMVVGQQVDPMFTPQPNLMRMLGGY